MIWFLGKIKDEEKESKKRRRTKTKSNKSHRERFFQYLLCVRHQDKYFHVQLLIISLEQLLRKYRVSIAVTCSNLHRKTENQKFHLYHILNESFSIHCYLCTILMLIHILYSIFVIDHPSTTYIVTLYLPISQIPEHLMLRQMIKTFLSSENNLLQKTSFLELEFTTCFLGQLYSLNSEEQYSRTT